MGVRLQLIEHAKETFARRGYVAASLRDLAEQVGVTAAAVYYHFEKKEDLLREIVFDGLEQISQSVVVALAESTSPVKTLEAVVRAHLRYNVECPRETKIIIEESRFLNAVDYATVREKQNAVLNVYRACISQLIRTRQIPAVDPTIVAFNVTSIILGWYRWYREYGPMSKHDAFEFTVAFAMAAVMNVETAVHVME
jgi:TetR/AcrR family transcriptional regulator, cholesterol catabolism regulator